jgi:hypothetical protein
MIKVFATDSSTDINKDLVVKSVDFFLSPEPDKKSEKNHKIRTYKKTLDKFESKSKILN